MYEHINQHTGMLVFVVFYFSLDRENYQIMAQKGATVSESWLQSSCACNQGAIFARFWYVWCLREEFCWWYSVFYIRIFLHLYMYLIVLNTLKKSVCGRSLIQSRNVVRART